MPSRQTAENDRLHEVFRRAVSRNQLVLDNFQLEVNIGEYQNCTFLKLDKANWHNRDEAEVPGQIFFSIWMDENGRLNYNIHAFKLRHLTKFNIKSREFATSFRTKFQPQIWPNVSTAFGPLTLMQGWIEDEIQIDEIIKNFISIHHVIDELMEEKRK